MATTKVFKSGNAMAVRLPASSNAVHWLSGLTVTTGNVADFADVPGLMVEDWSR